MTNLLESKTFKSELCQWLNKSKHSFFQSFKNFWKNTSKLKSGNIFPDLQNGKNASKQSIFFSCFLKIFLVLETFFEKTQIIDEIQRPKAGSIKLFSGFRGLMVIILVHNGWSKLYGEKWTTSGTFSIMREPEINAES